MPQGSGDDTPGADQGTKRKGRSTRSAGGNKKTSVADGEANPPRTSALKPDSPRAAGDARAGAGRKRKLAPKGAESDHDDVADGDSDGEVRESSKGGKAGKGSTSQTRAKTRAPARAAKAAAKEEAAVEEGSPVAAGSARRSGRGGASERKRKSRGAAEDVVATPTEPAAPSLSGGSAGRGRRGSSRAGDDGSQTPNDGSPGGSGARHHRSTVKPKIMFTMLDEATVAKSTKVVKGMGGAVVNDVASCTHMITKKPERGSDSRSLKFLQAVGLCSFIVSPDWITASSKAGRFVDEAKYSVQRCHGGERLFGGMEVWIDPQVAKPPKEHIAQVVTSSGGTLRDKEPLASTANCIVISNNEKSVKIKGLVSKSKKGLRVLSWDSLKRSVLQGTLMLG